MVNVSHQEKLNAASAQFQQSFITTLECFTGLTLLATKSLKSPSPDANWVGSSISLDGADSSGMLLLCMTNVAASEVTKLMLGLEEDPEEDELTESVGELTNIVAGSAKQHLSHLDINPDLARPKNLASLQILELLNTGEQFKKIYFEGLSGKVALAVTLQSP